jgi:hypothetical protein
MVMLKKNHIFLISSVGVLAAVYGCSSSNNSGSGSGSNGQDAGTVAMLDGSASDSASSVTPDAAGGSDAGASEDAATCPASVAASDIPTYAAAAPTPGICTDAQITAFVVACDEQSSTQKTCNAWFNDTTNATCANCISPSDSNQNPITGGPQLVNPTTGDVLLNTPGCVATEDKTNGTACASPLANYEECEDVACGQCASDSTFQSCTQSTSTGTGGCATYYTSFSSACASDLADGGVAANNGECQDPTFVYTLYCGGADGGAVAVDAGDGG